MNACTEYEALLDAFADGALTAGEAAGVQLHLDECPACRAYLDDLLAIRAAFPSAEDTELPAGFTEQVLAAVADAPQSRPKRQPWRHLAIAAACLCCVVLLQQHFTGGKLAAAPTMAAASADNAVQSEESAPESREFAADKTAPDPGESYMTAAGVPESPAEAPQAFAAGEAGESWVQYDNVVFSCVVYLTAEDAGDALDGYEGRPYSNARRPEDGVIGTGYALEQADFERILYEELDYPLGPTLNQDRTTELCCIVVTDG